MRKPPEIPQDEMDLACAIAETHARGLKAIVGSYYRTHEGVHTMHVDGPLGPAEACCAVGALALCLGSIGAVELRFSSAGILAGNDSGDSSYTDPRDCQGITLGAAYAHAMGVIRSDGRRAE